MVPALALGCRFNVQTQRKIRTLSVILDMLAKEEPAKAADVADVAGQRLEALERSALDGHWQSAQYLELISPDHGPILEKSEEAFVAKQVHVPKGAKRDQKGGKAPRPKGQGRDSHGTRTTPVREPRS